MLRFWILALLSFSLLSATDCYDPYQKIIEKRNKKYKYELENTTWIVPPATLPAIQYLAGVNVTVSDQTVWTINRYENGYFFGQAYAAINGVPSSEKNLVGSVTPYGDVYITFYPVAGEIQDSDIIVGIGKFRKVCGKYTFIMQMNSGVNNVAGLSHWSYMIGVEPDDYYYRHLPGLGISVPEFINEF